MRWIVALLMTAALAGCSEAPSEPEMNHEGMGGAMHMMQNVTFFDDVIDVTQTVSGEFAPTDHATVQTVNFLAGLPTTNVHGHDISSVLPQGIPVFIELEINAPAGVYAVLAADDFSAIWTSDCGNCEGGNFGSSWSGAVLNTGQLFTINVFDTNSQVPRAASYTVDYRVSTSPDRIPSGVVIEVDMPDMGSHILFESVEGQVPSIMVFDPNDVYVRTIPGGGSAEMYIEDEMATGAYAFLPIGHGSFYKLRSGSNVASGSELQVEARILQQVIQTGGPQPAGESGSMVIDMPVQPLQTGILIFGGLTNGATMQTAGPDGFSLSLTVPAPSFGFGVFTQTPMGDDRLKPGSYTISWEAPQNDGSAQVQEFFTLYAR